MFRSTVAIAVSMLFANLAYAGASSVPIIIFTPAVQPGNACIPDGVGSGEETRASNGDVVLATRIHGASAARCPDARFPNLASTDKLPSDEERKTPSAHCVSPHAKVGDELMIPSYGRAIVLELVPGNGNCTNGVLARVAGAAVYRAAKERDQSAFAAAGQAPASVYEPTELDVQREYDRMVATMAPVQEYHVRHILVATREEALAALEKIHAGRPFADVAAGMSIDTGSKKTGGDLGWNVPSSFIPEFSKSMVSLAPSGLANEPVKTKFGWHVVELLETKVGKDSFPPLPLVRTRIAARLRSMNNATGAAARIPVKAVCRKMVDPVLAANDGAARTKGTVVAEMRVENGRVADVLKLSGPSEYYGAVTDALKKYECDRLDRPAIAVQSFEF